MKKKWFIPIGVILGILAIIIAALWVLTVRGFGFSVGRCLVADNGSYMLIAGNSPIVMSNRTGNENLFANLETGDKIFLLHDGVNESYPSGTGVYALLKLENGDISDIPEQVLTQLIELGWVCVNQNVTDGEAEIVYNQAVTYAAQYIRTDGYHEDVVYPAVKVIRSVEELNAYYEANKELYDLERKEKVYADTTIGFLDACDKYDEAYFEKRVLILVLLEEGSGSIRHEVTGVETTGTSGEQKIIIRIETEVPEVGTCDMAEWHIFVEPEAGVDIGDESSVTVYLDDKAYPELCGYPKISTLEGSENNGEDATEANRVSYSNMSINIPEGWEYEINEYTEGSSSFGISFWPEGETEGKLKFLYYEAFGVCGTGLSQEIIKIGNYEASKATYGNSKVWNFIALRVEPRWYVILNEGATEWLAKRMEEVMAIIETICVAEEAFTE